jgi:glyoxylase-like metal-dependent hydrolase (beta-lactamase superfamily II)
MVATFVALDAYGQRRSKQNKPSTNFKIEQVAPGIWAAIQNDNYGKAICNAGIVDLGDKTLVFDPFMTPQAARELRDVAEELTKKPVSIVVNSHFHNDHIRGNQVFAPEATIVSTTFTRNEIERVEPIEQEWEQRHAPSLLKAMRKRMSSATSVEKEELPLWIGYYEGMVESSGELEMTLPDIVFNDSLWIMGSERNVKLVECKDGHTASDAVLLLPDDGVVFMGDLLFVERHPWLSDGKPDCWQKSLEKFYADSSYHTFIPGHGPVSKRAALKDLHQYLTVVQDLTKAANSDSLKVELMQQPIPQPFQHWYFGRFYQPNLQYLLGNPKNGAVVVEKEK